MAKNTRGKAKVVAPTGEDLAELGLQLDHDGLVSLKMLTGASGEGFSVQKDEEYRCDPATAVRFARKRIACQGHARP